MNTVLLEDFLSKNEVFHVARNTQRFKNSGLHSHNFVEVFWVEKGEGVHLANGVEDKLKKGDIVFIRAQDTHQIRCYQRGVLQFVNIAFDTKYVLNFKERFYKDENYFWGGSADLPLSQKLNDIQLNQLSESMEKIFNEKRTPLMLEWFLVDLFRILNMSVSSNLDIPNWLSEALEKIKEPDCFKKGSEILSILSHKSKEHTSRITKKYLSKTPSQIVNDIRLNYAGKMLVTSNIDILNLSLNCGFKSLAQFYALFKKRYGLSPKQYRKHHRSIN
jgi:hypothetical protein